MVIQMMRILVNVDGDGDDDCLSVCSYFSHEYFQVLTANNNEL